MFRSCIVFTIVPDNAKQGRPSLKPSSRSPPTSGSNKKDYRWGETPSLNCQWDCSPIGQARQHTVDRSPVADSAKAAADTASSIEVGILTLKSSILTFYPLCLF